MKEPKLVAECLKKMKQATKLPISVKCRLGVDDLDSFDFFKEFIETIYNVSGIDNFIIHARICLLKGLSPEENRKIPELKYDFVY